MTRCCAAAKHIQNYTIEALLTRIDEFKRLMTLIGRDDLAQDPSLADNAGRVARVAELDRAIGDWTAALGVDEVLAARIPAVIDYVVPGQEEGNAEMLTSRGCGIRTHSPAETGTAVASILAHEGAAGRRMRAAMAPISVPDAAVKTAQAALKLARPV